MSPATGENRMNERSIELLRHLVAMPTESRTPNRALIDWVAGHLASHGATTAIIGDPGLGDPADGSRVNLLARLGPAGPGGLLLSAHTDVVPAGHGWDSPPYTLTPVGDVLVGRGTADMKGFLACVLALVETLDPNALRRPLHLALSYDEEIGCVGVRSLLDRLATGEQHGDVRPDLLVIGEPTMMRPRNAHPGKVGMQLTFSGRAGHSSLSAVLPSCISSAAHVIAALEVVGAAHRESAAVTVNVGSIHGGSGLNVLAEHCEMSFELRHSADFDPDALLAPVFAAIAAEHAALAAVGGGVTATELSRYPALRTDPGAPWVGVVERVAARGPSSSIGFGAEGGLFAQVLDAPVLICGPGDIEVAHRPGEHIALEQLRACSSFLTRIVDEVCVSGPAIRAGGQQLR